MQTDRVDIHPEDDLKSLACCVLRPFRHNHSTADDPAHHLSDPNKWPFFLILVSVFILFSSPSNLHPLEPRCAFSLRAEAILFHSARLFKA